MQELTLDDAPVSKSPPEYPSIQSGGGDNDNAFTKKDLIKQNKQFRH